MESKALVTHEDSKGRVQISRAHIKLEEVACAYNPITPTVIWQSGGGDLHQPASPVYTVNNDKIPCLKQGRGGDNTSLSISLEANQGRNACYISLLLQPNLSPPKSFW